MSFLIRIAQQRERAEHRLVMNRERSERRGIPLEIKS
jgi:hypothetical protein